MHYPLELHIGKGSVSAHLLFEMLAYTIGYRLYVWQRARSRDLISDENRMWILLGAAFGAVAGSHLLGVLENPEYLRQFSLPMLIGSKTVLGGLLGGLIGVELTKKRIGVRSSSGDLMTYPLIAAMMIGRLGCHFAGLTDGTHGSVSDLPWAVDFGDGQPRHPVNVYEILYLAALACFMYYRERRQPLPDGMRFKLFMAGYLFWRFAVEFLKPVWFIPGLGLSPIQLAALGGLWYYRKVWFRAI